MVAFHLMATKDMVDTEAAQVMNIIGSKLFKHSIIRLLLILQEVLKDSHIKEHLHSKDKIKVIQCNHRDLHKLSIPSFMDNPLLSSQEFPNKWVVHHKLKDSHNNHRIISWVNLVNMDNHLILSLANNIEKEKSEIKRLNFRLILFQMLWNIFVKSF